MTPQLPAARPRRQTEYVCQNTGPAPSRVDRWDLLSVVTALRKELGLADRDIMVLRAHLSVLPHGLLDPTRLNISFMSVSEILGRACGMDERRFRRGEARLEAAGLVARRLSANGRRFPERNVEGTIVNAYGIDLAPLLACYGNLLDQHRRIEEDRLALRALKNAISARFTAVMKTLAASAAPLPHWIDDLREHLRNAIRRKATPQHELRAIDARISELENSIPPIVDDAPSPRPAPIRADSHASGTVRITTESEPRSAPTTSQPDTPPDDDGQTVRHIESKQKERNSPTPCHGLETGIDGNWQQLHTMATYYPAPPSSPHQTAKILFEFSSFLGLGTNTVEKAIESLGLLGALIAIDYVAENISKIGKPQSYLMSMLRCREQGEAIAGGRLPPVNVRRASGRDQMARAMYASKDMPSPEQVLSPYMTGRHYTRANTEMLGAPA
ncbi:helix-turn-helix domain-containing protein [Chachezhania sediminis]|uniref:helix-turn-helix domain-containing protein n=1 Tax=Chachezhania sediminis TaxID=2599291 RepID=UPI001E4C2B8F|nr:helix-turn-helix domain-containing protein [Chachezhania sediminis]